MASGVARRLPRVVGLTEVMGLDDEGMGVEAILEVEGMGALSWAAGVGGSGFEGAGAPSRAIRFNRICCQSIKHGPLAFSASDNGSPSCDMVVTK